MIKSLMKIIGRFLPTKKWYGEGKIREQVSVKLHWPLE